MNNTIIIGSGITGLTIGSELQKRKIEKAKKHNSKLKK